MRCCTLLVISHEPAQAETVLAPLRNHNCQLVFSANVDLTAALAGDQAPALLILVGSHQFCRPFLLSIAALRARKVPPVLVVATCGSEAFAVESFRCGASDYFSAGADLSSFKAAVRRLLPAATASSEEPLTGGDVLVGKSPIMEALRLHIRRVAGTDCNVLITGETGTGKELVAQLVHHNSTRSAHPLVPINCAAIPDALLESELFGYERGAFTGAHASSQGKLMTANKGSVFFDEIGEMSAAAQAKILRAIETKEVQRLGTSRRHETDIRILAATHRNLDEYSSAQSFRRDLYFRLNVGRIHMPPLRDRKSDIVFLVERIVSDLNRKLGRRIDGVTHAAMQVLVQHDWPGNVRELKNIVERSFIQRESGQITPDDLPGELRRSPTIANATPKDDNEMHSLRDALANCNGNKSKAAERLNCSRMTLYRKLAKYGLGDEAEKVPCRDAQATDGATLDKTA